ncbi:MAG: site-specific DNA-methyltransferase [Gammaproteobacteria bacterium]|nr:site-specific DNA-methyltransferase [Gammaproteobacteria bacterium]
MKNVLDSIQCGDATTLLKQLPDQCADLIITSPPYYLQRTYNDSGLGVGQERTPEYYLEALLETFTECVRVIKPTGNIVYNIGDKYLNGSLLLLPFRFATMACDRFPVKLVNEITWVKRNPTPRQFDRRLVSSTEPFFHFAVTNDYYYDRKNFCQVEQESEQATPTPKLGQKYRELINGSGILSEIQKQLAHRELDEVIAEVHDRKIHSFRMKIKGIHAEAFGGQEGGRKGQMDKKGFTIIRLKGEKMKRDVIESKVESLPGNVHTAIFPLEIIEEMIRLLSPNKGLVIDPYIGSGTTAVAAIIENRHYLGIDIDPDYCVSAMERISEVKKECKHAA